MRNKVPPPILTLAAILAIWALKTYLPFYFISFPFQDLAAYVFFGAGVFLVLEAGLSFKKSKTTVNPFRPDQSSAIVATGSYRFTRNPMYLGMALIVLAAVIKAGNLTAIIPFVLFILYMTETQIKTEERALEARFGQGYLDYKSKVRRWI